MLYLRIEHYFLKQFFTHLYETFLIYIYIYYEQYESKDTALGDSSGAGSWTGEIVTNFYSLKTFG